MSVLHGKIRFRVYLGTLGNGFLYTLDLNYNAGTPEYPYSTVTEIWKETFDFGNPANLQPVPARNVEFPSNAETAKFKLVSTGHGWGNNNTGNAAEFHEDTHHIWIDGAETFEQHNWYDCNPNPDGCSPQNGTWFHDRAGWCPGAIAQWFDYDMTSFIGNGSAEMDYIFNEDYVDLCHAENPNCVSGVTCGDCNSGFNPHLIVASYLITNGNEPLDGGGVLNTNDKAELFFAVFPNPASDVVNIELPSSEKAMQVSIFNNIGQVVKSFEIDTPTLRHSFDIADLVTGVYTLEIRTAEKTGVQKLIVE
jgi:hypothetical protein